MTKNLTQLYRNAVRAACASVGTIAEEAGYSRASVQMYQYQRPPSTKAALRLAEALRKRAEKLTDYADRLEEATGEPPRAARRVGKKARRR